MTRVFAAVLLVLSVGCESDARKLERLTADATSQCAPVNARDSLTREKETTMARMKSTGQFGSTAAAVASLDADLTQMKQWMREDSLLVATYQQHPEQAIADSAKDASARTACTLSRRALNQFMAGR